MNEGDGGILVCASIVRGMLERSATVSLSTRDGSATSTSPRDFSAVSTEFTFDPHTSMVCTNISVKDDKIAESSESFMVMLSGSDPGVEFVSPTTAIVTINDNDKATVGFEMEQYHGEEGRSAEICAIVKGDVSLERRVIVQLSTMDVTASGLTITSKKSNCSMNFYRSVLPSLFEVHPHLCTSMPHDTVGPLSILFLTPLG